MKNFLGVDIGGTKMYMVFEFNGEYIEKKVPTGINVSKEYIKEELEKFIATLPCKIDGIGIALPGLVDGDTLLISNVCPNLGGVKTSYFENDKYKVCFINDVKASLVAEASNYPSNYTVCLIMAGTGIAAAVKTDGKTVLGANAFAGELGSNPIMVGDKICTLDSLASGAAILKKGGNNINDLLEKLNSGDEKAKSIIEEAGSYFGIGLVSIIHLFNPHVIVIGGSTSTFHGYMEAALKTVKENALSDCLTSLEIRRPKDIKRLVALGAREFALECTK